MQCVCTRETESCLPGLDGWSEPPCFPAGLLWGCRWRFFYRRSGMGRLEMKQVQPASVGRSLLPCMVAGT